MSRRDYSLEDYRFRDPTVLDRILAGVREFVVVALAATLLGLFFGLIMGVSLAVCHWVSTPADTSDTDRAAFARICTDRLQAGLTVPDACRPLVDGKRGDLEK